MKKWINSTAASNAAKGAVEVDFTAFNYIDTDKDTIEGAICVRPDDILWSVNASDSVGPADSVGQAKTAVETLTKDG